MKCIRYWPDLDEWLMYGSVIAQTESEYIFAEFTIRTLIVFHEVRKFLFFYFYTNNSIVIIVNTDKKLVYLLVRKN
jgi:hypothetical protein